MPFQCRTRGGCMTSGSNNLLQSVGVSLDPEHYKLGTKDRFLLLGTETDLLFCSPINMHASRIPGCLLMCACVHVRYLKFQGLFSMSFSGTWKRPKNWQSFILHDKTGVHLDSVVGKWKNKRFFCLFHCFKRVGGGRTAFLNHTASFGLS